jgi:hypothetical protein
LLKENKDSGVRTQEILPMPQLITLNLGPSSLNTAMLNLLTFQFVTIPSAAQREAGREREKEGGREGRREGPSTRPRS